MSCCRWPYEDSCGAGSCAAAWWRVDRNSRVLFDHATGRLYFNGPTRKRYRPRRKR